VSLADVLFDGDLGPDEPAVFVDGTTTTVAELRARADAIATSLRAAGVQSGQVVMVSLPNGAELVATLFGVWRAGAIYVPLNPRLTATESALVRDDVQPAAVVTPEGIEAVADPKVYDDATALIQFTSGTTGRPKAVLLEHDGVLELLDGVVGKLRTSSGKRSTPMPNLVPVSLSLWAGLYQVLFAYRVGAPVVLMERFEPEAFARLVHEHEIRSTVLPPAAMTMLCDAPGVTDLAPLKYVRSITAPLSPLQARRFRGQFGITVLNGYGQTEIGGEIVGWSGADAREFGEAKLGSVGRPHREVQVRAVDPAGATLGPDEAGELWVMTPAISAGYAAGGDLSDRLSPDGWFRTGDVGRVDADGFVWIEGRVSDMINRGGLKVYPEQVAEVLRLSPAVTEGAVVGVADERLGEVPWAFVVPTDPAAPPTDDELDALARQHLAPYKVPVGWTVVDELPRNEVGKVLTPVLSALIPAGQASRPTEPVGGEEDEDR
jgi:acyl-CoA synthetase (AMP-forming)/AMP-acid ligase II